MKENNWREKIMDMLYELAKAVSEQQRAERVGFKTATEALAYNERIQKAETMIVLMFEQELASVREETEREVLEKIDNWLNKFESNYCDWNSPRSYAVDRTPEQMEEDLMKNFRSMFPNHFKKE